MKDVRECENVREKIKRIIAVCISLRTNPFLHPVQYVMSHSLGNCARYFYQSDFDKYFCSDTFIEREKEESSNDRNDRAIRATCRLVLLFCVFHLLFGSL